MSETTAAQAEGMTCEVCGCDAWTPCDESTCELTLITEHPHVNCDYCRLAKSYAQLLEVVEEEHEYRFHAKSIKGHDCGKNGLAGNKLCQALAVEERQ